MLICWREYFKAYPRQDPGEQAHARAGHLQVALEDLSHAVTPRLHIKTSNLGKDYVFGYQDGKLVHCVDGLPPSPVRKISVDPKTGALCLDVRFKRRTVLGIVTGIWGYLALEKMGVRDPEAWLNEGREVIFTERFENQGYVPVSVRKDHNRTPPYRVQWAAAPAYGTRSINDPLDPHALTHPLGVVAEHLTWQDVMRANDIFVLDSVAVGEGIKVDERRRQAQQRLRPPVTKPNPAIRPRQICQQLQKLIEEIQDPGNDGVNMLTIVMTDESKLIIAQRRDNGELVAQLPDVAEFTVINGISLSDSGIVSVELLDGTPRSFAGYKRHSTDRLPPEPLRDFVDREQARRVELACELLDAFTAMKNGRGAAGSIEIASDDGTKFTMAPATAPSQKGRVIGATHVRPPASVKVIEIVRFDLDQSTGVVRYQEANQTDQRWHDLGIVEDLIPSSERDVPWTGEPTLPALPAGPAHPFG